MPSGYSSPGSGRMKYCAARTGPAYYQSNFDGTLISIPGAQLEVITALLSRKVFL